nr:uncharacterized protein LOC124818474 [Hydra vulgaris]
MSFTIKNVCSGFSKCGIYPLNRQIFGESDFISSSVSDRPLLVEQPEIKQPDNQQSYEINKLVDSSESSVKIVSPESIYPYPKAPPRKDSEKRRKQGKSTILTKTPEKTVNKKNIFETGKITTQNLKRKIDLKRGKETEIFDADFLIVSSVKNVTGRISLGLLGFSVLLVNGGYVVIVIITARSVIINVNYVKLTVDIFYTFFDGFYFMYFATSNNC